MKKILIFLSILLMFSAVYSDSLTGKSPSTTYKKTFVLDSDSLLTSVSAGTDGRGTSLPFSLSTTRFLMNTTNKITLYDENNYLFGSSANDVELAAGTDLLLNAGSKVQFISGSNYIDTSGNLVLAGNATAVDGTFTGDLTITDDVTADSVYVRTIKTSGAAEFTNAITANGGVVGDLKGNVTSSGISGLATVNATGIVNLTYNGEALDVDYNANIDGTLTVDGASTFGSTLGVTGVATLDSVLNVTSSSGIAVDRIIEYSSGNGVTVEGVELIDGNIKLNASGHYISFDLDDKTYLYSDTGNVIDVKIDNADDFTFSANKFTAIKGSSIATNIIQETSSDSGVTIDGCLFESQTSQYNIYAPSGKYICLSNSDTPAGHGLAARTDLFVGGKLEVDGAAYFDGDVSIPTGKTLTVYAIDLGGTDPTLNPTPVESSTANDLYISGGVNSGGTGGDLYLDGGGGTSADGDVILGNSDGNVDIQTFWGESDSNVEALAGNVTDLLRYQTSIYTTTTADTVTIGGTPFEGMIKQYIIKTMASGSVLIEAGAYDCMLDAAGESVRYKYVDSAWYIIGKNN